MKPIVELEKNIDNLESAREDILELWISFDEVKDILNKHKIEPLYFKEHFAAAILDYFVGVVRKDKDIGDCPVMAAFLDFLKEHDISSAELFLICTHFRKAMLDTLFDMECMSKTLFDEVSYVFDLNFSGVLDQYSGRIYSAQRETKIHKRRFQEYNLAIDHSAMVCKVDLEGIITYANPRFSEVSGFSQDELVGKLAKNLRMDEENSQSLGDEMWEQLKNKEVFHGILKNRTKDGEEYYTETTIVPMLDLNGETEEYLSIRYDVSELIQARDKALDAERVKDQFLANMSHEIRTPLNAILGFVAVLRNRVKDAENRKYLDVIHNSGENLLAIIADILDFAKIKEGKLHIERHMFNPMESISGVLELFNSKMLEKDIHYLTYIDPNLPLNIKTDVVRLNQVLANFLSNALKFTPEHGTITVTAKLVKNQLVVSVKDSGCGIEKEAVSRIFSAFEQAEGSTTRKYGGTGLGLSICQQLVEMMGGDIQVESEIDKGSLFRLVIPIESSAERNVYASHDVYVQKSETLEMHLLKRYFEQMGMNIVTEPSAQVINFYTNDTDEKKIEPYVLVTRNQEEGENLLVPPLNAYKIMRFLEERYDFQEDESEKIQYFGHVLVAEDNHANQMLMKLLLEEYGLSHVMTSNGEEAYEAFKQENFSLVLMDEQMPILGGLEATEKILQYEIDNKLAHTPIISVTANALKGDREKFLEAGMDGYIAKPIENDKLEEVLSKYIQHQGENVSRNVELPSYNNLSAEEMASQIGLNVKHIPILVQSFTDESEKIMADLEAAIASKNYADISSYAHSIKGSSGNLKFTEMYELAKDLELSAKDGAEDFPYEEACASIKKAIESISL